MKIHNIRSPEQWEIISRHVDFKDKTVLDLGCGKGDILFRAFDAGATVLGLDNDISTIEYIDSVRPEIDVIAGDIDFLNPSDCQRDIIICFSVLPYLKDVDYGLKWINSYSVVSLIECQYAGDGPGLHFLRGNDDMERWLLEVGKFKKVQLIGHTLVEGRNKNRFIWMCE